MHEDMIGTDLKTLRIEAGLNQVDLAEKLGITQGALSRIERGTGTTTDVVERWVQVCEGTIRIEGKAGLGHELDKLVNLARMLDPEDMRILLLVARGLKTVPSTFKAGMATMFAGFAPETQSASQPGEKRQTG